MIILINRFIATFVIATFIIHALKQCRNKVLQRNFDENRPSGMHTVKHMLKHGISEFDRSTQDDGWNRFHANFQHTPT